MNNADVDVAAMTDAVDRSPTARAHRYDRDHARRLRALAYRMPGSRAEAEDVVQEAWLRWADVDESTVEHAGAFLSRLVTNLCRMTAALGRRAARALCWRLAARAAAGGRRPLRLGAQPREACRVCSGRVGGLHASAGAAVALGARGVRAARGVRPRLRRDRAPPRAQRGRMPPAGQPLLRPASTWSPWSWPMRIRRPCATKRRESQPGTQTVCEAECR